MIIAAGGDGTINEVVIKLQTWKSPSRWPCPTDTTGRARRSLMARLLAIEKNKPFVMDIACGKRISSTLLQQEPCIALTFSVPSVKSRLGYFALCGNAAVNKARKVRIEHDNGVLKGQSIYDLGL